MPSDGPFLEGGGPGGGFGGGGGSGGIPASAIFETGLTQTELRTHAWKGLLVGLQRSDAGSDWTMKRHDRDEDAVPAKLQVDQGNARMVITLPAARDVGAAGNDWTLYFEDADVGNRLGVEVSNAQNSLRTRNPGAVTFSDAADRINDVFGAGSAVASGADAGTEIWPDNGSQKFAGGVDAQSIAAVLDAENKNVTVYYDNNDTLQEILDALERVELDSETVLFCSEIAGTDLTAKPEIVTVGDRPFILYFSEGSLGLQTAIDQLTKKISEVEGEIPGAFDIQTFSADSDGNIVGDAKSSPSYNGHFLVTLTSTNAAKRSGFELPAGRSLDAVIRVRDGRDFTARFGAVAGNAQRFYYDADLRAGSVLYLIETS